MATQHLQHLLEKEVSRKEFLGLAGLAVASIFGFGTVVKLFTGKSLGSASTHRSPGYGGSDYGSKTESTHTS